MAKKRIRKIDFAASYKSMSTPKHVRFSKSKPAVEVGHEQSDEYCIICDDGGDLVECSLCHVFCCYNEIDPHSSIVDNDLADNACVTLPAGFNADELCVFRCPSCLAKYPDTRINYTVNRGSRATQRRTVNAQLVLIISYLSDLADRGKHIFESIQSVLRGFHIMITCYECVLPELIGSRSIKSLLSLEGPYHLVYAFVTESQPTGGWWFRTGAQASEGEWLRGMLRLYDGLATKALSARIFGLCCGVNLPGPGVIRDLSQTLRGFKWDSFVLPAASAVVPEEYGSILPEVFLQLYYNGSTLRSSLLRVWASSKRCRVHTDLLVIDQIQDQAQMSIKKYSYAPYATRPWGIDLPVPQSFCNCPTILQDPSWRQKTSRKQAKVVKYGEYFARYQSSCKHTKLMIAVFARGFVMVEVRGTQVVLQDFDPHLDSFPLDTRGYFKIKISLIGDTNQTQTHRALDHNSPWTTLGLLEAPLGS